MNSVVIAILIMVVLTLILRIHVVISLFISSIVGGFISGMPIKEILILFEEGLSNGASLALSYGLLGVFSVSLYHSGLPKLLTDFLIEKVKKRSQQTQQISPTFLILMCIALLGMIAETIIPIHIAYVFILIPFLITLFNQFALDRRAVACSICFGLVCGYMIFPIGYGNIYLNKILLENVTKSGTITQEINVVYAMFIPCLGMFIGLLFAMFITYRKKRIYQDISFELKEQESNNEKISKLTIVCSSLAIIVTFFVQWFSGSLLLGSLGGILVFIFSGVISIKKSQLVFDDGFKMMAMIGLIMISSQGFSHILQSTGDIESLVLKTADLFFNSKPLIAFVLLLIGLLVTLGIGSSFATIPIIAALYVPLCLQLGFSPLATLALVGTAGALGDAGSPASDSTLAPTAALNLDGQHDHIKDTVIPTVLHFNIPLLISGWIAAMVL